MRLSWFEDEKCLVQLVIFLVAMCHIVLHICVGINIFTVMVGISIQILYSFLLDDYPNLKLNWCILVLLCGQCVEPKFCFTNREIGIMTLFCVGILVINMRQWISIIENRTFSNEIMTTVCFFACVWMVPLVLASTLDIGWSTTEGKICQEEKLKWFPMSFQPDEAISKVVFQGFLDTLILGELGAESKNCGPSHPPARRRSISGLMHFRLFPRHIKRCVFLTDLIVGSAEFHDTRRIMPDFWFLI